MEGACVSARNNRHPLDTDIEFYSEKGTVTIEDGMDAQRVVACFLELVAIAGFKDILDKYKIRVEASR